MNNLIGKRVTVYNRYLFAIPVKGIVIGVSDHDGGIQIRFDEDNPGRSNVTKYNGSFFFPQECDIEPLNKDVQNIVWILPDSRPEHYPGSWPAEFEEKLLTLYGFDYHLDLKEDVVQLFSGGVQYGFKIDLQEDSHPDYHGDSHSLPEEWTDRWKMCILDPPYTSNWSRVLYGCSELLYSKYISEAVRIVQPGGFIACYHWSMVPTPDTCTLQRRIFIGRDYFKKLRVCMIFQKR